MEQRRRLPPERRGIIHHFNIGVICGYINVGLYCDGKPGEVFIIASKEGSTFRGLLDVVGILISLLLQHNIPLKKIADKLRNTNFQPNGMATGCNEIVSATSILDYVAHFLELRFPETTAATTTTTTLQKEKKKKKKKKERKRKGKRTNKE